MPPHWPHSSEFRNSLGLGPSSWCSDRTSGIHACRWRWWSRQRPLHDRIRHTKQAKWTRLAAQMLEKKIIERPSFVWNVSNYRSIRSFSVSELVQLAGSMHSKSEGQLHIRHCQSNFIWCLMWSWSSGFELVQNCTRSSRKGPHFYFIYPEILPIFVHELSQYVRARSTYQSTNRKQTTRSSSLSMATNWICQCLGCSDAIRHSCIWVALWTPRNMPNRRHSRRAKFNWIPRRCLPCLMMAYLGYDQRPHWFTGEYLAPRCGRLMFITLQLAQFFQQVVLFGRWNVRMRCRIVVADEALKTRMDITHEITAILLDLAGSHATLTKTMNQMIASKPNT